VIARFASALGGAATLEVDVNYMARQPLFGSRADGLPSASAPCRPRPFPVVDLHEIAAGKLVALLDRRAARDLFDARRLLAVATLDWTRIKAAVLAFGASGRRDWRLASTFDIGGDPRELRQKLVICLPRDYFEAAGGVERWIEESVAICRERLAFLFDRSPGEQAFLDGVLDRGEIDASLLGVDPTLQGRIAAMPMLEWKARNVREHRAGQRSR